MTFKKFVSDDPELWLAAAVTVALLVMLIASCFEWSHQRDRDRVKCESAGMLWMESRNECVAGSKQ